MTADLFALKETLREKARKRNYFEARKDFADAHEQLVRAHVVDAGWVCEPWGQALLSPRLRDALRRTDCPARWSPDLLAVNADGLWLFIDAKAEMRTDTEFFSLERAAYQSHEAWAKANGTLGSFVYVWDDLTCSYIEEVADNFKLGTFRGSGSGTSFVLVPKRIARSFDSVFGAGDEPRLRVIL